MEVNGYGEFYLYPATIKSYVWLIFKKKTF